MISKIAVYRIQLSHWKDQGSDPCLFSPCLSRCCTVCVKTTVQHSVVYIPCTIKDVQERAGGELSYQKMINPVYLYIIKDLMEYFYMEEKKKALHKYCKMFPVLR